MKQTHATSKSPWTPAELKKLKSFKNPEGIQKFLDAMPYHIADTAWSPRAVLHEQSAHCLEGSIFAAAALRILGYKPLIWDLEAENDTDHVIAIYQKNGHWGAIAKSNYTGCRGREPVYKSLRELAMSYFHIYFNMRRERTLRAFSRPIDLTRFDPQHWMTTDKPVWFIVELLLKIPHTQLFTKQQIRHFAKVDKRTFNAEILGKAYKKN